MRYLIILESKDGEITEYETDKKVVDVSIGDFQLCEVRGARLSGCIEYAYYKEITEVTDVEED